MKFEKNYMVGIKDIGRNNQMTNYSFLSFLEEIACSHSELCGYGVNDVETKKKAWLLMDWKLKVLERPKYGEELHVKTWARPIGKHIFFTYRDFEVFNKEKLVAIATSKWVLFDIETKRISKITNDIFSLYTPENQRVFEEKEILKVQEPQDRDFEVNYDVKRSDIDINNHMHNLNYLRVAYEVIPDEIYYGKELINTRIMYKHQILYGDKIKCLYKKDGIKNIVTIKSDDEKILHAIVELS